VPPACFCKALPHSASLPSPELCRLPSSSEEGAGAQRPPLLRWQLSARESNRDLGWGGGKGTLTVGQWFDVRISLLV
jgi:hypothetical protein